MRRLISVIQNKRDKALFYIAYRHGLRASEVGLLKIADVDMAKRRIFITRLKGSFSAEYPLDKKEIGLLQNHLRSWKRGSPLLFPAKHGGSPTRQNLHYFMRKYCELAEIPAEKRHFHCLKHSIATHMLDAGENIETVRDWLGHKNIQNTLIYSQIKSSTRDERARRMFEKVGREIV